MELTQHSDGLFPVICGLTAGIASSEGRPPDPRVCPPDGVDHASVEECQKEDWNGVEDEKAEFVDWVTLIINIFPKHSRLIHNLIIGKPWGKCFRPTWRSKRNPPESCQS